MQKSVLLHSLTISHFRVLEHNNWESVRASKLARHLVWAPSILVFLTFLLLGIFFEESYIRIFFWVGLGIGIVLISIGWSDLKKYFSKSVENEKARLRYWNEMKIRNKAKKRKTNLPTTGSVYLDMMNLSGAYFEKEFNYLMFMAERFLPEDLPDSEIKIAGISEFDIYRLFDHGDRLDFLFSGPNQAKEDFLKSMQALRDADIWQSRSPIPKRGQSHRLLEEFNSELLEYAKVIIKHSENGDISIHCPTGRHQQKAIERTRELLRKYGFILTNVDQTTWAVHPASRRAC